MMLKVTVKLKSNCKKIIMVVQPLMSILTLGTKENIDSEAISSITMAGGTMPM